MTFDKFPFDQIDAIAFVSISLACVLSIDFIGSSGLEDTRYSFN